ncbi:MAG: RibD family protein [Gemmatimonadota bacterium]
MSRPQGRGGGESRLRWLRLVPALVVGQLGQSLDGRIATVSGHSHYINGPEDIVRLHRLRALADAVVVGAGTVASDDPRLTVRHTTGSNPVRVVLDPGGRLPSDRAVFRDGAAPTLWLQAGSDGGDRGGPAEHVRIVTIPSTDAGLFRPREVLRLLRSRDLGTVLVEGGGRTVSGFLQAGALDRLHLSVAPLLLGSGRPGITLPPVERLDEALRPRVRHFRLGQDLLFDLDLRAPAEDQPPRDFQALQG